MTVAANVRKLSMSKVFANPDQPRKYFEQGSIEELAASIKEHGQLQPITVVKRDDRYMIVMGERRFRACQHLGSKTVQAVIRDMDEESIDLAAMIENTRRKDMTPIEEAAGYKRMLDKGYGNDENGKPSVKVLAKKLGISQPFRISDSIKLLDMAPEYQDRLQRGELTSGQAWYICLLNLEQQAEMVKRIDNGLCPSATKLKMHYDMIRKADVEPAGEAVELELGVSIDSEAQARINKMQTKLEALAASVADLATDDCWGAVDGKFMPSQADVMAAVAKNISAMSRRMQVTLEQESAKNAV